MPALFAGLLVLCIFILMGKGFIRANPKGMAKGLRLSGGMLLGLATVALIVTGREAFAFITAGGAWFLLFGTIPPWLSGNYGKGGASSGPAGTNSPPARTSAMSRSEALKVLGLEDGASESDIRAAHRKLILQIHPDKGGTSYLAAKINEAKDVLLKR